MYYKKSLHTVSDSYIENTYNVNSLRDISEKNIKSCHSGKILCFFSCLGYDTPLYSSMASKQGHSLMRSQVSIRPLWFRSGEMSRCPSTWAAG